MDEQRIVLITGSAGGVGNAAVRTFSERGWYVIGVDRKINGCDYLPEKQYIQADISDPNEIVKIYRKVSKMTKSLHAVVNNAGMQITKPLLETSVEEWDQVMASNLRSAFLGAKMAHPLLKAANGAAIVNVSSVHAMATSANISAYAASKGGLLALTRAMAIEFAPDRIRVNALLPGAVDTEMLRSGLNRSHAGSGSLEQRLENLASRTVCGRVGLPEEIARAIYFLADDAQSSFMTGQSLVIDGGATARLSTE
ncbi:MAG TPA: SDR family oxidoreductase [Bellilinea sp.]|nr:SDR family oxidoreductase [Bellilinea sp.]